MLHALDRTPAAGTRLLFFALILLVWSNAFGQEADEEKPAASKQISYYSEVRPIFQQHCQGCHQPAKASGGFVMTDHGGLLKAGDTGEPGVIPGNPEESTLLIMISSEDDVAPAMPKGKEPLSKDEVALIRDWIAQGAKDDTPASTSPTYDVEHPPAYTLPPVVTSVDYSADGTLLAVSGFQEVLLYSHDGSEMAARFVGLSPRIESVAFSPDGKLLAVTGGLPGRFGEVQLWAVAEKELVVSLPVGYDTVFGASWSPDGKTLAIGCADNTVRAIDVPSGKQVLYQGAHSDWVLDTVFSTQGTYVISASRDRSAKLTEVATQRFIDNVTSITPGALKGGLLAIARHPGTDAILVGGADGVPKIFRVFRVKKRIIGDNFNLVRLFDALPGRIFAAEFSKDGSHLVVGSSLDGSGEVRVYPTGELSAITETASIAPEKQKVVPLTEFSDAPVKSLCRFEGQQGAVYALAFHPDGKVVASAGFDGLIRLNDAQTGKLIKEFSAVPLGSGAPVASK